MTDKPVLKRVHNVDELLATPGSALFIKGDPGPWNIVVAGHVCRDCADLGSCSRDTGAHPDDPACTAFIDWRGDHLKGNSDDR